MSPIGVPAPSSTRRWSAVAGDPVERLSITLPTPAHQRLIPDFARTHPTGGSVVHIDRQPDTVEGQP